MEANAKKDFMKMQFYAHKILKKYELQSDDIIYILQRVKDDILNKEPNILHINPPIYIAGGIGGNFDDLKSIFDIGGPLPYSNYLFLGNYSENNGLSMNSMMLLLVYKYIYKENIYLIRGTNENKLKLKEISQTKKEKISVISKSLKLTLDQEIMFSYDLEKATEIWDLFTNVFNALPIAAVVGNLYFCADSSLSFPDEKNISIDYFRKSDRTLLKEGSILINNIQKTFLSDNKLSSIISGLNLKNPKAEFTPTSMKIYSSPNTYSSDCYVIEINEHKIANPIKMRPIIHKMDRIFTMPSDIFIY